MLHKIPFEIEVEIVKRLPIKSVIQCRSVSKAWKSLIDSSQFIAGYSSQLQHLLVRYQDPVESECKFVCFVDDDTFPQQKFTSAVPLCVKQVERSSIIVSACQGLLCLYDTYEKVAVLWNPCIRKSVVVALPKFNTEHCDALGFGVCPGTSDPKIIYFGKGDILGSWQIKIFTLSSGSWRNLSSNQPRESIDFPLFDTIVIGKFIYWLARDRIAKDPTCNLIMSFDLADDEFREIPLPDSLALKSEASLLSIFKMRESLALIENIDYDNNPYVFRSCDVWMMEYGVPESFIKLFRIKVPDPPSIKSRVCEFSKSGKPILEVRDDHEIHMVLAVYEPYSGDVIDILICGHETMYCSLEVKSYTETLLLLNEPDCSSYLGVDEVEDDDD